MREHIAGMSMRNFARVRRSLAGTPSEWPRIWRRTWRKSNGAPVWLVDVLECCAFIFFGKPYQLCLVGKCRICGGRLCMEQRPVEADSTDGFLAAVYRHLYHFHRSIDQDLPRAAFRTKFVEMFRKEDRAAVEDWLSRLENQSIHTMICGNAKRAYTIVHSWADADQGNFPAPEGMAAFTVKEVARKELARLVAEEKENRTILFPAEEYCEEYGEDFWEAYRDGYAAGWFTRYEIIESPLYAENIEEKGGAADDAAKTDLL